MKVIIVIALVFISALSFWYFISNSDVSKIDQSKDLAEYAQEDSQGYDGEGLDEEEPSKTKDTEVSSHTSEKTTKEPLPQQQELVEEYSEDVEDDYSEEVSAEDFADFINTALEEVIEEDEATALAIVTELSKIIKAQPNHVEEGIRFYQGCVQSDQLSEKVKILCQDELNKQN